MRRYLLKIFLTAAALTWVAQTGFAADNIIAGHTELIKVEKGHSRLVRMPGKPKRVSVADQKVADVLVIAPDQLYINGRKVGATNIVVWDKKNQVIAHYEVKVGRNLTLLKKKLAELLPGEKIAVHELEGVVVLSGRVSSKKISAQAESLAMVFSQGPELEKDDKASASAQKDDADGKQSKDSIGNAKAMGQALADGMKSAFGGGGGKKKSTVRNLLEVGDQKQVLLKLKFAEVNKGILKRMGINLGFGDGSNFFYTFLGGHLFPIYPQGQVNIVNDPTYVFDIRTDQASVTNANKIGNFLGFIDMLKSDGLIQVLAEPNLVCVSGESANFLAGGEFPVPVPGDGNITIFFKPYGVQLKFTPEVLSDGRIRLLVAPEVSEIDFSNAVEISGYQVPGVTTRRAKTRLELNNGQSFALAGLLKRNLTKDVKKFPFLGDIPILGNLFRSNAYQRQDSELLIVVTPEIVSDSPPREIIAKNSFDEPGDVAFYLRGKVDASSMQEPTAEPKPQQKAPKPVLKKTQKSGLMKMEGKFGHEVVY
jgi:pilus assembly protein CpaC